MYTLKYTFYEFADIDVSQYDVELIDSNGEVIASRCTYEDIKDEMDPDDIWQNQIETHEVKPDQVLAIINVLKLTS